MLRTLGPLRASAHCTTSVRCMAGHSKWKTIKHSKASNDQKRSALFTKIGREVMSSARLCAGDLSNPRLSSAIAKAKANNVPKDNIEFWMNKATGAAAQDQLEEVVYEGLGPGSVQMVVRALTDNRKRTFPNVRHQFNKFGGELGASGSVMWNFERTGYGAVKTEADPDAVDNVQEICIDNGANDVDYDEEASTVQWYCDVANLMAIRKVLEEQQLSVELTEILYRPKDTVQIPEDKEESLRSLLDALEDDPDIQDVSQRYVNNSQPLRLLCLLMMVTIATMYKSLVITHANTLHKHK